MDRSASAAEGEGLTRGQHLAGVLLVGRGMVCLGERLTLDQEHLWRLSGAGGPSSVLLDVVPGMLLLSGRRGGVELAMLRVSYELVLIPMIRWQQAEALMAGAQLAGCVGLLLLLVRRAGRPGLVAGLLLFAVYAVIELRAVAAAFVAMRGSL